MCKTKKELDKLVAKRRELSAEKKKIEAKLGEVDKDIIDYVLAKGVKGGKDDLSLIVIGDGYKVSYITVVKHPLDSEKVKKFLGVRLPQFQTDSVSNKLTIS